MFDDCSVCGRQIRITINRGSGFCCELCRKKAAGE